jgi:hypothetical protein
MNLVTDVLKAALRKWQTVRLHDALGMEIQVNEGCLWLTQERDAEDHVIEAGGSFRIDHPGVALLTALGGEACAWSSYPAARRLAPLQPAVSF